MFYKTAEMQSLLPITPKPCLCLHARNAPFFAPVLRCDVKTVGLFNAHAGAVSARGSRNVHRTSLCCTGNVPHPSAWNKLNYYRKTLSFVTEPMCASSLHFICAAMCDLSVQRLRCRRLARNALAATFLWAITQRAHSWLCMGERK